MTKEKLAAILEKLPAGTLIYVRVRDDAWPAKARRFTSRAAESVLYIDHVAEDDDGDHRNFPEGYSGAKEVPLE